MAVFIVSLRFLAKSSAGWSGGPGSHARGGGQEERGAGPRGCGRCAGWLPREERHKGIWMEASASHYVRFVLKGNTTQFDLYRITVKLCAEYNCSYLCWFSPQRGR